ncbi:DUF2510 domain-containing protein [Iamia sp.]|uniref:DUF2510 domain-containing protein n=1 Tax=Iamia sp. TaxID=2722710 RepID=UPI002CFAB1AF|nr:DUF2510 domain-containing protein [Iamia sp.]HXH58668.1 DUF2510 domain-containing protein [Iamia sp.]
MAEHRPAAWHPDPENPGQLRYWDGLQWTEHRNPDTGAGGRGPDPTTEIPQVDDAAAARSAPKSKSALPYILIPVGACLALFLLAGIIGAMAGSPEDEGEQAGSTTQASQSTSTSEATTEAPTVDAPATTVEPTTATTAPAITTTAAPTTAAPTTAAAPVFMPDVMCMNLQVAQDAIQAAGVFFSRSEDASGQGRSQLLDANWIVVGQNPAAGTLIGEGDAVLSAVKIGEPSPC